MGVSIPSHENYCVISIAEYHFRSFVGSVTAKCIIFAPPGTMERRGYPRKVHFRVTGSRKGKFVGCSSVFSVIIDNKAFHNRGIDLRRVE